MPKKRSFSEIHQNELTTIVPPQRKRQKIENNTYAEKPNKNESSSTIWACPTCSLHNDVSLNKCSVCATPQSLIKPHDDGSIDSDNNDDDEFEDDDDGSWYDGDEEEDIDLDTHDGQKYLPVTNIDIIKRSQRIISSSQTNITISDNNSNSNNISVPKQTEDGRQYYQLWLCYNTSCGATNRLLDTQKLEYKCSRCNKPTYKPDITQLFWGFEWDSYLYEQNNKNNKNNNNKELQLHKKKSLHKDINNRQGEYLIVGLINQLFVRKLIGIPLIGPDLIRLFILFMGGFEHDAWDNHWVMIYQRDNFIIDGGLINLQRTLNDKGSWKNAFGMRDVVGNDDLNNIRYEWIIQIKKIRNRDWNWDDEMLEDIIIGIIESDGIKPSMNAGFHSYKDGYGFTGDALKVNDGKYEKFGNGFGNETIIKITLQWKLKNKICQLMFGNNYDIAYHVNPNKSYKLAASMKDTDYVLKWISFMKYNRIVDHDS